MIRISFASTFLIFVFCANSSHAQNLLVDADFEFGFIDSITGYITGDKLGTNPPDAGVGGWQVIDTTSATPILHTSQGAPQLPGSSNQAHMADGGGNTGLIRQEFATTIGQQYLASAFAALNCCEFNGDFGINIHAGGVGTGEISVVSPRKPDWTEPFVHQEFSTIFTADATTSYIEISNVLDLGQGVVTDNGAGMNIDDASVTLFSGVVEGTFEWNSEDPGDWNGGGNWTQTAGVSGPVPNGNDDAIFGLTVLQDTTVFTDSDVTVRSLQFDNENTYNVAGVGTVTIDQGTNAGGSISVDQGSHQFQAAVSLDHATTIDVAGAASLDFQGPLSLNGLTNSQTGSGTLLINNSFNTGVGEIQNNGTGTVGGGGKVGGDLNNVSGTVAPGNSAGTLTVEDDFTQAAGGTLAIEIGGSAAGDDYDVLDVGGMANLNGTLAVTLIDQFTPTESEQFTVLTSGGITGSLSLGGPNMADFSLSQVGNNLLLTFGGGDLAGDYNNDGTVNAADYTVWRDGDSPDSTINGYNLWKANYGNTGSGSSAAVPEPSSVALVLLAALWGVGYGRRHHALGGALGGKSLMKGANAFQACVVAVCLTASANANLLVDGGFEFGGLRLPYTAGTYNVDAQKLGTNPQAAGTGGWQVIADVGGTPTYTFSVGSGDPATQDGSDGYAHVADGGTFGTIRQEFATDVGQLYELRLWGRLNCCGASETGIAWDLGGVANGLVKSNSFDDSAWTAVGSVFDWLEFTDTFTANDTTSYINLSNEVSGMNFDDVSITEFTGVTEGTFEWTSEDPGSWNLGGNWTRTAGTTGPVPNGNDDAIFGLTILKDTTVFTDSDVTVRSVQFDNSNSYNVAGVGTVTIDQGTNTGGAISVDQGSHQFQAAVSLDHVTTIDVAGGASLVFQGPLSLNDLTHTKTGGGTLLINDSFNTGGGTITGAGGAIGGSGVVGGNLNNVSGTVAPGNSPGGITGSLTLGGPNMADFSLSQVGNNLVLTFGSGAAVPEPTSMLMMLLATAPLMAGRRKERK